MALLLTLWLAPAAQATPWMFDQDGDGIDDRLNAVAQTGLTAAYENGDPGGRLRFEVGLVGSALQYGGYVRFATAPTPADSLGVALLGAQVISRLSAAPYLRVRASWPTLLLIRQRPGVDRIEAVTLMYSLNWRESQELGIRAGALAPFPALEERTGLTGQGVVVALLDTGVNDQPVGLSPGHMDLAGRVVGGADYGGPGPSGYTWWTGSVNPSQSTAGLPSYHATHLAGTLAGGVAGRAFGGLARGARLVDVKVLADDGTGSGLAEGLEWCWRNRLRPWGSGYSGIQVVNLSLSAVDPSNGDDCVCALVNRLADAGILVVAAAGNDGACGELPAPGAADGALTVGAYDAGASGNPADDALAAFTNEGPRADDGDGTHLDEMKPDLVASGVNVTSAWGSPLGDGHGYRVASGTSMATAQVAGTLALLRQADPGLTPAAARDLLHRTARHRADDGRSCSAGLDPYHVDARYHAGWGYGELDALAAWLDLTHPTRTQFLDVRGTAAPGGIELGWTTQKEVNITGFTLQRAPDVGGAPGAWVTLPSGPIPATGAATLAGSNRTTYSALDPTAPAGYAWYRIMSAGGATDTSAACRLATQLPLATAFARVRHAIPEADLSVSLGAGLPDAPVFQRTLTQPFGPHVVAAVPAPGSDDDLLLTLSLPLLAADGAASALPPAPERVWWLELAEGGDPARNGRLEEFRIEMGAQTYPTGTPLPQYTVEGGSNRAWIPALPTSAVAGGSAPPPPVTLLENPARGALRILLGAAVGEGRLELLDVQGRAIRVESFAGPTAPRTLSWVPRDAVGRPLAAGRYFLRLTRPDGRWLLPVLYLR